MYRERMNTKRPPRATRARILRRDRYQCVDCRHRRPHPETMLEVDHDIELADGGTNDDDNLITRCTPHHQAKTEESRMAREAVAQGKKPPTPKVKAATAAPPSRPLVPVSAYTVLVAATGISHVLLLLWGYDQSNRLITAAVAAAGIVTVLWVARVVGWRRRCEAQRVYQRLCKTAHTAPADQRRFKVHTWRGFTPVAASIQPGPDFPLTDPAAADGLAAVYAAAVAAPTATADPGRRGWVRLTTAPTTPRTTGPDPRTEHTPVPAPVTPERAQVAARIRDAILPLVDGQGTVTVTEWWDDADVPRAVRFDYAPAAARAARDSRAELAALLTDVCPPRARDGHWRVRWEPAHDQFAAHDTPDPLAPVVPLPPIEDNPDLTVGPVVGVLEDGQPWRLPILQSHLLVAGATGAGKGSVLWSIIRGLLGMIHDGRVRLWVIDPKGGMELGAVEPLAHRFVTATGAAAMLEEAAEAMEAQAQRLRTLGLRKLETPTVDMPLHVIVVDELAALTSLAADSRERNAMNATMGRLLTQGRAVGFTVIGALQDPRQKNLDNRNLFPVAVALRLKERQMVDMVLGAGARASGAVCDLIPRALPGVGYVVADGQADTLRVRAAFVPDEEVKRMVAVRATPDHARTEVGEQLELPAAPAARTTLRVDKVTVGMRVLLPDDPDPVTITDSTPDEDEPARWSLTYIYDGETGERECSFDADDTVTVADA